MDLLLVRLAGMRPPGADALREMLLRQDWLTPDPTRRGSWSRSFAFSGGQINVIAKLGDASPYATAGLQARLLPDADFTALAPHLVSLAGALRLGIDTGGTNSAFWWPAPDPGSLESATLDRAIAASRACDPREAWPLLGFALAGPECLELAESHAALAFLLANTPRIDGRYRVDIPPGERLPFLCRLARRPRREILAALDFPATESMVRLLGKIPAARLNLESLRLLRDLRLAPHALKALRHLPAFGSALIPIAVRRRLWPHVGPQLLREIVEQSDEERAFFHLRDTIEIAEALGRIGDVGVVLSREALEALHDTLRREYESRPQRNLRRSAHREAVRDHPAAGTCETERAFELAHAPTVDLIAPAPPLREPPPPPLGLVPLRTRADLRQEGREMSNCVGSYWRRVERGYYVVCRVLCPERATLGLRWSKARGSWAIDQIKGYANETVRADTRLYLRDWLETGLVDQAAARWALDRAHRRHREALAALGSTTDPGESARLRAELARLRTGELPG